MIEKNEETKHTEAMPWKIRNRCATFEEADNKRIEILAEEGLQVKIKWSRLRDDFMVKTRLDPALAFEEEVKLRREEKKRRKAKLNKKRRKK
jgi:hypothetical protein